MHPFISKLLSKTVSLLLLISLVSCYAHFDYDLPDEPPPLPPCYLPARVRIALVLGGGGARGLAHVGVLEELENANIPIDIIIGCSAGSLVGALYADCQDADKVKSILEPLKTKDMLDIHIWRAKYGLSQGYLIKEILQKNLYARTFQELRIPFLLVTTDLSSAELVTIGGGPLIPAVLASCAVPFVFSPVKLHGRMLADGGVIDPIPVNTAKMVNAEIIVAVDVRCLMFRSTPTNLFDIAKRSADITLLWQGESCVSGADVVIQPNLGDIGMFDDQFNNIIYEAGRQAAREAIPKIMQLFDERCSR
jgi:NTE family protein